MRITVEQLPFRKHKVFFYYFKILLKYSFLFLKKFYKLKGFYCDVRGKLSVAGNAKKRHYGFSVGTFYKSTKNLKATIKQGNIQTFTGILGYTLVLTY